MTTTKRSTTTSGFTDAERAAMRERAAELQAEGKKGAKKADDLQNLLDKIAEILAARPIAHANRKILGTFGIRAPGMQPMVR